jgi:hypothetical protein
MKRRGRIELSIKRNNERKGWITGQEATRKERRRKFMGRVQWRDL